MNRLLRLKVKTEAGYPASGRPAVNRIVIANGAVAILRQAFIHVLRPM